MNTYCFLLIITKFTPIQSEVSSLPVSDLENDELKLSPNSGYSHCLDTKGGHCTYDSSFLVQVSLFDSLDARAP